MISLLLELDRTLFLAINNGLSNPFLNELCLVLRNQSTWYPMYGLFVFFFIKTFKTDSWKIILGAALMVLTTDQFSANLVKNTFMRLRPCAEPLLAGKLHHLTGSCNGYSFISAHATNHFAVAIYLSFWYRQLIWLRPLLLVWAASIAFSQVYVGVHYPMDVIVGALAGVVFANLFAKFTDRFVTFDA